MKFSFAAWSASVVLAFSILPVAAQGRGEATVALAAPSHRVLSQMGADAGVPTAVSRTQATTATAAVMPVAAARERGERTGDASTAQEPAQVSAEPSTFALTVAGLVLIGLMLLRRRSG